VSADGVLSGRARRADDRAPGRPSRAFTWNCPADPTFGRRRRRAGRPAARARPRPGGVAPASPGRPRGENHPRCLRAGRSGVTRACRRSGGRRLRPSCRGGTAAPG